MLRLETLIMWLPRGRACYGTSGERRAASGERRAGWEKLRAAERCDGTSRCLRRGWVAYNDAMPMHVQIRIISLLEEAANSFEQLETLANRTLGQIPHDQVDQVELRSIERDYVNDENEPGSEMD